MKKLVHIFKDGKQFLDHYSNDGWQEKLFLLGVTEFSAGDQVDLEIRFKHSGYAFHHLTQVLFRRVAGRGEGMPAGTLISLVGVPGRMVAHAKGQTFPYRSRIRERVHCCFPVTIVYRKAKHLAEAVDYSPGGIQIVGGPLLEIGSAVELRLHPLGSLFPLTLLGQIVWVQEQPERAYGLNLHPEGNFIRRRLHRLYEHLLVRRLQRE
jgi:hypothetical protein